MIDNFGKALSVLESGGVILYPTDTIWGIGCDATNPEAVEKIYTIKHRPADKGLIVMVDSIDMLKKYVHLVHPRIETLLSVHLQPLTIIYDSPMGLAPNVAAPDGTVAIRVTLDAFCKQLIGKFKKPIISTSANVSGTPFPTHFGAISSDILQAIDFVVKYKNDLKSDAMPSVIAKLDNETEELIFMRE
ncbi:MAG: threonylcarbamoyl-AMP synthase [Saprospiraceae bacterium]|nr:threonylcarbamoyl-AMP synthase [Saprospiraceae bacterium]